MDARIIDITPSGGPDDVEIWQIEIFNGGRWHRSTEGDHSNTDPSVLREVAKRDGLLITDDESL